MLLYKPHFLYFLWPRISSQRVSTPNASIPSATWSVLRILPSFSCPLSTCFVPSAAAFPQAGAYGSIPPQGVFYWGVPPSKKPVAKENRKEEVVNDILDGRMVYSEADVYRRSEPVSLTGEE
jgi:hypothetical protein